MNASVLPLFHLVDDGVVAVQGESRDVALAARGDMDAFERLYRANVEHVRRLARRMVDADEVEDATQDVFVRVWKKAKLFRGDAVFRTWLHALAINVLIRRAQRSHRMAERFRYMDVTTHAARDDDADARLDVERALNTLTPDFRAVVVLHDLEGYSHGEIGEMLGIGTSATRMRLHRARQALRAFVGRGVGSDD
jgi:RNA polymerase sigma-70 factor (ECF subfamily)